MSKYKDFVEEYNLSYKFSHNKKHFSYPIVNTKTSNTYTYASFSNVNSRYDLKKDNYYTAEPTEKISESPTTLTPSMQTNSPTTYIYYTTKCPSITNFTSFMPTLKIVNNNINNNINNNNDLIIALTIPFSAIFLTLILFIVYYYKFYLKTKQNLKQQEREKEFDLDFGLSYVDDF
jgi:hypothetical protein